jgi:hypothetical protein
MSKVVSLDPKYSATIGAIHLIKEGIKIDLVLAILA